MENNKIPKHVAIIMDGNRRWAAKRRLPAMAGHVYVLDNRLEELIEKAGELGIGYITFWAWSTENWTRGKGEVRGIMKLFRRAITQYARRTIEKGARIKIIGDIEAFDEDIKKGLKEMMELSKNNTKITVTFALNYGGRDELVRAMNKLATRNKLQGTDKFEEGELERYLDTAGMPEPDLIIRTGGVKRTSGFMLWQSEYSEYYFTEVLMPDFGSRELERAVEDYGQRERRYGGGKFGDYQPS